MPELPEVETVRRMLEPLVVGQRILEIETNPTFPCVLTSSDGIDARQTAVDATIELVSRRGKYLVLALDNGFFVIAHLRMTGRLLVLPEDTPPVRFEHCRIILSGGVHLRFGDQRKFGRIQIATPDDVRALDERLGIEPLSRGFTAQWLATRLSHRPGKIKSVLLDQQLIAGLGNIYVDEALFRSRIHPLRSANTLSAGEIAGLHRAIRHVLRGAIAHQGTTFSTFENPYGEPGNNAERLKVYGKGHQGVPCPRCGTTLERLVVGGRGTTICSTCQPWVSSTSPTIAMADAVSSDPEPDGN